MNIFGESQQLHKGSLLVTENLQRMSRHPELRVLKRTVPKTGRPKTHVLRRRAVRRCCAIGQTVSNATLADATLVFWIFNSILSLMMGAPANLKLSSH